MAVTVRFMVHGENTEHADRIEMTDVPVPSIGARIELDGLAYVVNNVVISYWSNNPTDCVAWVDLREMPQTKP